MRDQGNNEFCKELLCVSSGINSAFLYGNMIVKGLTVVIYQNSFACFQGMFGLCKLGFMPSY